MNIELNKIYLIIPWQVFFKINNLTYKSQLKAFYEY